MEMAEINEVITKSKQELNEIINQENFNFGIMYGLIFGLVGGLAMDIFFDLKIKDLVHSWILLLVLLVVLAFFLGMGIKDIRRIKKDKNEIKRLLKIFQNHKIKKIIKKQGLEEFNKKNITTSNSNT